MRRFAILLFAFLSLSASAQEQPKSHDDWRFAHPDATLVGSIKLSSLFDSPVLAAILRNEPNAAMSMAIARGEFGGVKEIRFSLQQMGTGDPDVLALIQGHLNDQTLSAMVEGKAKMHRLADDLLLLGNSSTVDDAARRMMQPEATLKSRAIAATDALSASDVWIAGQLPPLPPDLGLAGLKPAGIKLDVRAIAMGLSLGDDIDFQLSMETASPAMAAELVRSIHEAEDQQPAQYKGKLLSSVEGSTARFHSHVPRQEALDAIRMSLKTTSAEALPPPTAVKPRRITIQGLDEGPREVPFQSTTPAVPQSNPGRNPAAPNQ
ncbi:MAG: hypothetical protein ABI811_00400 [Acidobacteriota bacterium]